MKSGHPEGTTRHRKGYELIAGEYTGLYPVYGTVSRTNTLLKKSRFSKHLRYLKSHEFQAVANYADVPVPPAQQAIPPTKLDYGWICSRAPQCIQIRFISPSPDGRVQIP